MRDAVAKLPERQQRIVELRYGLTTARCVVARGDRRELGLTRERIRQLERDALAKLENELHGVVSDDDLAPAA